MSLSTSWVVIQGLEACSRLCEVTDEVKLPSNSYLHLPFISLAFGCSPHSQTSRSSPLLLHLASISCRPPKAVLSRIQANSTQQAVAVMQNRIILSSSHAHAPLADLNSHFSCNAFSLLPISPVTTSASQHTMQKETCRTDATTQSSHRGPPGIPLRHAEKFHASRSSGIPPNSSHPAPGSRVNSVCCWLLAVVSSSFQRSLWPPLVGRSSTRGFQGVLCCVEGFPPWQFY